MAGCKVAKLAGAALHISRHMLTFSRHWRLGEQEVYSIVLAFITVTPTSISIGAVILIYSFIVLSVKFLLYEV